MIYRPKSVVAWAAVTSFVALLAACGGGGSDTAPRTEITSVRVMGDSIADVGTFGIKFTIQGNDTYSERISQTYGLGKGCNFFAFNGTTFVANPTAGCKNYAIGGGRINGAGAGFTASDPRIVGVQFATATAAGNFGANELLVVDGGGNDAADLVGAYLRVPSDAATAYKGLLSTLLSAAEVNAALAGGAAGLAGAGQTYMTRLADTFYNVIKTGALDKGAQRVVLLNVPNIIKTPRFQAVLDGIAVASGGGAAGATARAQSEALFTSWVEAFNKQLAIKFAGSSSVVVIDFYTAGNDAFANPAQFGLTNVKTPACPATGVGSDGLATYSFATCTEAALNASPPAGVSGSKWYSTWAFSDSFHPSPYYHQVLAQLISRSLANAGWL